MTSVRRHAVGNTTWLSTTSLGIRWTYNTENRNYHPDRCFITYNESFVMLTKANLSAMNSTYPQLEVRLPLQRNDMICDMIWYDNVTLYDNTIWYDMICDMIWYDNVTWYDNIMISYDMIWYDTILRYDVICSKICPWYVIGCVIFCAIKCDVEWYDCR